MFGGASSPAYVSRTVLADLSHILIHKTENWFAKFHEKLVGIFLCVIVLSLLIRFGKFDIFMSFKKELIIFRYSVYILFLSFIPRYYIYTYIL